MCHLLVSKLSVGFYPHQQKPKRCFPELLELLIAKGGITHREHQHPQVPDRKGRSCHPARSDGSADLDGGASRCNARRARSRVSASQFSTVQPDASSRASIRRRAWASGWDAAPGIAHRANHHSLVSPVDWKLPAGGGGAVRQQQRHPPPDPDRRRQAGWQEAGGSEPGVCRGGGTGGQASAAGQQNVPPVGGLRGAEQRISAPGDCRGAWGPWGQPGAPPIALGPLDPDRWGYLDKDAARERAKAAGRGLRGE